MPVKKIFTQLFLALITVTLSAQAPQKLSYQFVVRNASGVLVTNSPVGVRVAILQGSPTGTIIYNELFNPNPVTNANGLVSIEIGTGLPITGTFSSINWAGGPYYLKTETDPTGSTSYTVVGTSQLISVPYALYSGAAESIPNNSVTSAKIADGTILTADLANSSITSAKIADGNVGNADLLDGSVTSGKIADGTIAVADLADGSITSAKILDATVATADLANSAVTSAKIAEGTIATADIANGAITIPKINITGVGTNMVLYYTGSSLVWDYAPGSVINYTFLNVSFATLANYTSTYQKVANIGTVSKLQASSRLKVTYYGRIKVNSVTSTGGYFELRVDDAATTNGRANANFRVDEVGYIGGATVCISGVFTGLGAGTRTISMWVRASGSGTGTGAQINPGSWAGDYIIVEEIK